MASFVEEIKRKTLASMETVQCTLALALALALDKIIRFVEVEESWKYSLTSKKL